jgi:putative ABC transport system substrate-binding protein
MTAPRWVEYRFAYGRQEKLPDLATELVRLNVSVLITGPGPQALAAQAATRNIPIVFGAVTDPVGQGFVASLAKPGANMTGLATQGVELLPKRLELLKQAVPSITTVDVLMNPADCVHEELVRSVRTAGRNLNLRNMMVREYVSYSVL